MRAHGNESVRRQAAAPSYAFTFRFLFLLAAFLPSTSVASAAVLGTACSPTDSLLVCRLRSVVTLLDIAAMVLAVVFLGAVLAAVRAYRRKPRQLTPKVIDTHAR